MSGCWVKAGGESDAVHYDAIKVPQVKDSTGAGDCFIAGFLDGVYKGKSIPQCVEGGTIAASFVIQHTGTDLPEDQWAALRLLVQKV